LKTFGACTEGASKRFFEKASLIKKTIGFLKKLRLSKNHRFFEREASLFELPKTKGFWCALLQKALLFDKSEYIFDKVKNVKSLAPLQKSTIFVAFQKPSVFEQANPSSISYGD
jgi:hypothetical protein